MNKKPIYHGTLFLFHHLGCVIDAYRFLFLFLLLILFFILKSVSPDEYLNYVTSLTFLIVVFYSLIIISQKRPILWKLGLAIGSIALFLAFIELFIPLPILSLAIMALGLVFYALMFYVCLYFSLKEKVIGVTTLFGPLCAYLFMGLFFATLCTFHFVISPNAYTNIGPHIEDDFIYYSFITLTTLGYGDIIPISQLAKTLAWIEAYLGQAYLTVLMALMVGRYLKHHQEEKT